MQQQRVFALNSEVDLKGSFNLINLIKPKMKGGAKMLDKNSKAVNNYLDVGFKAKIAVVSTLATLCPLSEIGDHTTDF